MEGKSGYVTVSIVYGMGSKSGYVQKFRNTFMDTKKVPFFLLFFFVDAGNSHADFSEHEKL